MEMQNLHQKQGLKGVEMVARYKNYCPSRSKISLLPHEDGNERQYRRQVNIYIYTKL